MNMNKYAAELVQARKLLQTARFCTMATVNPDGTPHNSPVVFLHNSALTKIFWGSHPESVHSQNILRTGQLFMVIYGAFEYTTGLYFRCVDGHALSGVELNEALRVHNAFRKRIGKNELSLSYYTGGSPQRMWSAKITNIWINSAERGIDGHLTKDFRVEVKNVDFI